MTHPDPDPEPESHDTFRICREPPSSIRDPMDSIHCMDVQVGWMLWVPTRWMDAATRLPGTPGAYPAPHLVGPRRIRRCARRTQRILGAPGAHPEHITRRTRRIPYRCARAQLRARLAQAARTFVGGTVMSQLLCQGVMQLTKLRQRQRKKPKRRLNHDG